MNMFFVPSIDGGIPSDSDDIGQSAYVGGLLVQAAQLRRQGPPFSVNDRLRVMPGIDLNVGAQCVSGASIGVRKVEHIEFSERIIGAGCDAVVVGWSVKLSGLPFLIRCDSLQAA